MRFFDVTSQIVFNFVSLVAKAAGVRSGFRVILHVAGERSGVLERLAANGTRAIGFVAVRTHVVFQFVFGSESLEWLERVREGRRGRGREG